MGTTNKNRDVKHSDENYDSFEDWESESNQMFCPYMDDMMPYEEMYRDEDDFEDDFDEILDVVSPMHRPRCRWPYRPCFYGGRWHCCRRRRPRPRPRPWWMY